MADSKATKKLVTFLKGRVMNRSKSSFGLGFRVEGSRKP